MSRVEGHILTPQGFVRGALEHEHGRIAAHRGRAGRRGAGPRRGARLRAARLHRHPRAWRRRRRHHGSRRCDRAYRPPACAPRHHRAAGHHDDGADGRDRVRDARARLRPARSARRSRRGCSAFISKAPTSAPTSSARSPTSHARRRSPRCCTLHALAPIRLITLAPELDGNLDTDRAAARGRHSACRSDTARGSYEDGVAALERGAGGFTHLFNAMSGMHHRAPGMVGAALAHAQLCRDHSRTCCTCTRARSAPRCARFPACSASPTRPPPPACPTATTGSAVTSSPSAWAACDLADGTLAGSTLTMDQALRNLVGLGLTLQEASQRVSAPTPPTTSASPIAAGSPPAPMPTSSCSTATCN